MKLKHSMIFVLGMTLVGLMGCNIKTPEIHGVVLDEETKQPVEGAWVRATLDLKSKTIQGDVTRYLSVDSPHTRTDKHGKFVIPSRTFKKPPFPIGFGTEAISFGIGAATVDDRGGHKASVTSKSPKTLYCHLGEKFVEHFKPCSLRPRFMAVLNILYGFATNFEFLTQPFVIPIPHFFQHLV